jgi:molybdate transport system substrate-binding protein
MCARLSARSSAVSGSGSQSLPQEIQSSSYFAGGVSTTAKHPEAAMQLIRFLKSPAAVQVTKAKGMTPE